MLNSSLILRYSVELAHLSQQGNKIVQTGEIRASDKITGSDYLVQQGRSHRLQHVCLGYKIQGDTSLWSQISLGREGR